MRRRKFLEKSTLVSTGALLANSTMLSAVNKPISPNDKLQIGVIGCNGMGWSNTNSMLKMDDVDLIGISDVDQNVITRRLGDYQKLRSNKPTVYGDYRKLIQNPEIDAVIIGTPDHWHCMPMVEAVQAGKHVYVEKPISNTIEECRLMVEAARKSGKVVQVGQWQRSGPHYRDAIDIVRSGKLGNIRLVKVWAYQGWMEPVKVVPDESVPEGVDYNFWLGPAPMRQFNKNRFHFNFRWFWDYAGGLMTDWGVHEIDIALFAMQVNAPVSVMATGGKLAYPDDASETPDTLQTVYKYDKFTMLWEHATGIDNGNYGRTEGIAFIGNNGTLVVNRQGYEVLVEKYPRGYAERGEPKMERIKSFQKPNEQNYLDLHTQNFVDSIKASDSSMLNTPIDSGSIAAINAQMGNIAYKTGDKVFWDNQAGNFKKNKAANKLIKAQYNNGWKLPEV